MWYKYFFFIFDISLYIYLSIYLCIFVFYISSYIFTMYFTLYLSVIMLALEFHTNVVKLPNNLCVKLYIIFQLLSSVLEVGCTS